MLSESVDLSNVALAVLAGGEGRRMGFAKAELRLHGRPILHVLLEQFAWPGPTLLITAPGREHPTGCDAFTQELVDPAAGQGPLRGLLTALENSAAPVMVVAAVDMPLVRHEQLRWLAEAVGQRPGSAGLMLRHGNNIEPLPGAFRRDAIADVRRRLESGRRSLHGLLEEPGFAVVDAPADWPDRTWANFNSPDNLAAAGG
jgi:molybdopterin-guanine dinucleotide biosynthesis protein A